MKNSILLPLILFPFITIHAQDNSKNHVTTYSYRTSTPSNNNEVLLAKEEINPVIQYYDGLGRATQQIGRQASPNGYDMVNLNEYDTKGRTIKTYLPVEVNQLTGNFVQEFKNMQSSYYGVRFDLTDGNNAFSRMIYENSPLDRAEQQFAPGLSWTGSNKGVAVEYSTNTLSDAVWNWRVGEDNLPYNDGAYYAPGELTSTLTRDEHDIRTIQFTNKRGQMILMRMESGISGDPWYDTYYVYDDFGRLRYVFPPKISSGDPDLTVAQNQYTTGLDYYEIDKVLNSPPTRDVWFRKDKQLTLRPGFQVTGSWRAKPGTPYLDDELFDSTPFAQLAFHYHYDARGRMITKKVPGADWTYMVYDKWDRLVLTQDGNQRLRNEWSFTAYDQNNRPAITGIISSSKTHPELQDHLNGLSNRYVTNTNSGTHGYNSGAFPFSETGGVTVKEILSVTYYDDYTTIENQAGILFEEVNESLNDVVVLASSKFDQVRGQVTGTKINVLGTSQYEYSVTYYDLKYRPIQTVTKNRNDEITRSTLTHDFVGNVLSIKTDYEGVFSEPVYEWFTYDHRDRLLETQHRIGSSGVRITTSSMDYNSLGEVNERDLHVTPLGEVAQSVDYQYNIRGWLTMINNPYTASSVENGSQDAFSMALQYDNAGDHAQHNGNIGGIEWKNLLDGASQRYAYEYDALNRLTVADYANDGNLDRSFDVRIPKYDENGNIEQLERRTVSNALMDKLTYDYNGNQLKKVTDGGNVEGFKDGADQTEEYTYDANGNMITDLNKGISSISYNFLNLPERVEMDNGTTVDYQYRADGTKLSKTVNDGTTATNTIYEGPLVIENDLLKFILTSEGRIIPRVLGTESAWEYQYFMKDHLGNVRATVRQPEQFTYLATMETSESVNEEAVFSNMDTRTSMIQAAHSGTKVARVNNLQPVGPLLALNVGKGDTLDMEVYAYYEGGLGYMIPLDGAALADALSESFSGNSSIGPEGSSLISDGLNEALAIMGVFGSSNKTVPGGYLNYILFNTEFHYLSSGFVQLSQAANMNLERLSLEEIIVDEPGYAFIYVSNESNTPNYVHFDDLNVEHRQAVVSQQDDYYPFGLTFNSYTSGTENLYRYNGKEEQKETGWLDYGARMFMPDLGRWFAVDPLADDSLNISQSHYNYALNNPILFIDPDGLSSLRYNGENNTLTLYDNDNNVLGTFTAHNNVSSGKNKWENGTFDFTHQNLQKYSDAEDDDRIDSRGIIVFGVPEEDANSDFPGEPGSSGLGVHAGREGKTDGLGRSDEEYATNGCIRTNKEAMDLINRTHENDPLTTLTVENNEPEEK